MWRGKDVVYNILGCLVFAMAIEMPFIAYREPPFRGDTATPPDPPKRWGGSYPITPHLGVGLRPPPQPPPAMRVYQSCELFAKAHGVGVVVVYAWWGVVAVDIPLWVTSKTMQVEWATQCLQSLMKKKTENWAKVTMTNEERDKTIGMCENVILVKSCHERTEGIGCFGQEECLVSQRM